MPPFSLIKIKKKPYFSPEQKLFSRLQKKIHKQQKKMQKRIEDFDEALRLYYEKILPKEVVHAKMFQDSVKLAFGFYQKKNGFSSAELKILKELILENLDLIFAMVPYDEIQDELKQMFKDLKGFDYDKVILEELGRMETDESEEFFEQKTANDNMEFQRSPREELQKKSLSSIFKSLAKILHPDLESDEKLKEEKGELMKQLTVAYEEKDLLTLLSLEFQYQGNSNDKGNTHPDEQLKIYNTILNEQAQSFQNQVYLAWAAPKYYPLRRFYHGLFNGLATLQFIDIRFQKDIQQLQQFIELLHGHEGIEAIRKEIQKRKKPPTKKHHAH
jgi:hypothetical protein